MINERELLADSKFIDSKFEKIKFMELLFKISQILLSNLDEYALNTLFFCSSDNLDIHFL